jgi:hypothetical protein
MALLQNRSRYAAHPYRRVGGSTVAADGGNLRSILGVLGTRRIQMFTAPGMDPTSSTPLGYQLDGSIFPPLRAGGMGVSRGYMAGEGAVTNADLINALRLIVAALSGAGEITDANGVPSKPALADLTGSGDVTDAALSLIIRALADLLGGGDITSAAGSGSVTGAATLTGSGDVDAALGAIANLLSDLEGSGDIDADIVNIIRVIAAALSGAGTAAAQPYATATMSSDISSTGELLTSANIAQLVWGALAAANNDANTMGAKLNSAASGGVDYDALAEAVWDDEFVDKLLTVAKFLGLK